MEKTYIYRPRGVCSREMRISYEDGVVTGLTVIGGCHGNLQGIAALVKGRSFDEIITLLSGIDCHGRGTSCPDQLSLALKALKEEEKARL